MFQSADIVFVCRILPELRRTEDIAEFDELIVVAGGDDHMPVGNREDLVRHDVGVRVADALGHFAGDEEVHCLV